MSDTKKQRRPRREFDRNAGVAKAQALFHARGFDGVGVAALTEALDINPPSLYAAYGSKLGLFERTMERYVSEQALPLEDVFREGRPLGEAIAQLFAKAADQYSRNSARPGCLVTEGARAADPDARAAALRVAQQMTRAIHAAIAQRSPDEADSLTDFVVTTLRGFSAAAYGGLEPERLKSVAQLSGQLLIKELEGA